MKLALDTNVLAYAEGTSGRPKKDEALDLIQKLPAGTAVLPAQTLCELFNVLVRKARKGHYDNLACEHPQSSRVVVSTGK